MNQKLANVEYQKPGRDIEKILRSNSFSMPLFNHQKTALIKRFGEDMPPLKYVARPQLKLGGLRFNPENYTFISNFYFKRLVYRDLESKKEKELSFPQDSILRESLWSPDGKYLTVSVETDLDQELWIVEIPSLKKHKAPGISLNSVMGRTIEWVGSDQLLIGCRTKNQARPLEQKKETPKGPVIQESSGKVSQNRTFADLVKTSDDERQLALAMEMQVVLYSVKTRKKKNVGKPELFGRVNLSPDQAHLLVEIFLLPFSKSVPVQMYARKREVWNLAGKLIRSFPKAGPFENLPIQGVPVGPRSIQWIESEGHQLVYAEALDQGDWDVKADHRDELFTIDPVKKNSKARSLLKLKHRFAGFQELNEENSFLITEYERDREWITTHWLRKNTEDQWARDVLFSLNENDSYADPGNAVPIRNQWVRPAIAIDTSVPGEKAIFLSGVGSGPEGERPFLNRFNLNTLQTEEWFRSQKGSYERFLGFSDPVRFSKFITSYESPLESPRFRLRTPKSDRVQLLYADPNPYQIFSRLKKEVITYERADGVKLSGVLHYPLNYKKGTRYPAIIQAYPLEYTDAATAGQVRGSPDRFSIPYHEDMIYNALRGYFVLDEAQMPIIGHPETKNDTFIEQLVSSAKAAVDTLTSRELIDPKRVGIVGHSYGAYMVANLLSHSSLFATGIAKSGAYNRTLTPYGFQGERRPLWKAKDIYLKMSPFLVADQVKVPILLIHGMVDNNAGTFTMQSERYFEALKGQGVQTRLVLLPEESHGYAAIESVEHVLFEIFQWFDRHLKGKES